MSFEKSAMSIQKTISRSDTEIPTVTFQNGCSECDPIVALSVTPKIVVTYTESDEISSKQMASVNVSQDLKRPDIRRSSSSNDLKKELTEVQLFQRSSSCSSFHNNK